MNAAASLAHDLSLPARGGDARLVPPGPSELLRLVGRGLLLPNAQRPTGAELESARWKPGVSVAACYRVDFEDGEERRVLLKRFTGDKAAHLANRLVVDERLEAQCDRLRPYWVDVPHGLIAWVYPADRTLPGARRVLDLRRTARLLNESGVFGLRKLRKRRTRAHLLRYRPERSAVHLLELSLRDGGANGVCERVVARVLPPGRAAVSIAARRTLAECEHVTSQPELLVAEPRTGILLERWVRGVANPRGDFSQAEAAGRALAALHCARLRRRVRPRGRDRPEELLPLLRLASAPPPVLPQLAPAATSWVHGDFHSGKLVFDVGEERHRLLDFDLLAQDDPARDLASWTVDRLLCEPRLTLRDAAGELLEGYYGGGGARQESGRLAVRVAEELVRRAAGCIRRLELGAVRTADRALCRAQELLPSGPLVA